MPPGEMTLGAKLNAHADCRVAMQRAGADAAILILVYRDGETIRTTATVTNRDGDRPIPADDIMRHAIPISSPAP